MQKQGLSHSSIKKAYEALNGFFRQYVIERKIVFNPMVGVIPVSYTHLQRHIEYKKLGVREISKGLEMTLIAGRLLPGGVNAVIVVGPMNTVYQRCANGKGVSFVAESSWSFYGKKLPILLTDWINFLLVMCFGKVQRREN